MKCQDCGKPIPDVTESADWTERLCDSCYALYVIEVEDDYDYFWDQYPEENYGDWQDTF